MGDPFLNAGLVDDTGHCRAAMDGDCAPAAAASFLWAAGIQTGENHLHFAMRSDPADGTKTIWIETALLEALDGSAWTMRPVPKIDPTAKALLVGFVRPENGERHMVCVIPDGQGGAWVHDPSLDDRVPASWESVGAYRPDLVIALVPRKAAA